MQIDVTRFPTPLLPLSCTMLQTTSWLGIKMKLLTCPTNKNQIHLGYFHYCHTDLLQPSKCLIFPPTTGPFYMHFLFLVLEGTSYSWNLTSIVIVFSDQIKVPYFRFSWHCQTSLWLFPPSPQCLSLPIELSHEHKGSVSFTTVVPTFIHHTRLTYVQI